MPALSKDQMIRRVVAPIIEAMKQGELLWLRGWNQGGGGGLNWNPSKPENSQEYTGGINNLLMWIESVRMNYAGDNRWMTYKQAKKSGWQVRKGSKGLEVCRPDGYWYNDQKDGGKRKFRLKGWHTYKVFNGSQIDRLPDPSEDNGTDVLTGYERAQALVDAIGITTVHGGNIAGYSPKQDAIVMPNPGQFNTADGYWATRLHENVHATGHTSRLDRDLFDSGMKAYAREELVAELGAAFASSWLGIEKTELTQNHAAYLQHWLKQLENKPEIFTEAVGQAWKAFKWMRTQ